MTLLTPSNLKGVKFELKGLDEYLKKVQEAGRNIDEAVRQAIKYGAVPVFEDVKEWAEKHELTGDTLEGVAVSEVQRNGNFFFVDVGVDSNIKYTAWHAVFVEYGTPTNAADPGIRRAFVENKAKVKKIQKEILQKEGMPID